MIWNKLIFCLFFYLLCIVSAFGQKINWQNLDPEKDSVFGTSTQRAYNELLRGKRSQKVIVAIIDTGIDTTHEDLRSVLWSDKTSGSHGWNYIGPETGKEDITKLVGMNKEFYDSLAYTAVPETYRAGYQSYRKLVPQLEDKRRNIKDLTDDLETVLQTADSIVQKMHIANPVIADFKSYPPANDQEKEVVMRIVKRLHLYTNWQAYRENEIIRIIDMAKFHLSHGLNLKNEESDTAIGNTDISPDKIGPVDEPNLAAYHGTHVAGIIGAVRNNDIGMNGIADNVEIMMLKANGTIRELRDKSLALAIYFAVDHGARIINLSFGKPYTCEKKMVDDAVKYAMSKDVLLIHAAGNAGADLDIVDHFPNPDYADKTGKAKAWIEVGASGLKNNASLAASFSNFGKRSVDIFAPGVNIYSTLPYDQYVSWDGTSMAAPVVTGVAALIREYYPKLTAVQVRDIILKTSVKSTFLTDKCVSGGVVNTYFSLKLAASYK